MTYEEAMGILKAVAQVEGIDERVAVEYVEESEHDGIEFDDMTDEDLVADFMLYVECL